MREPGVSGKRLNYMGETGIRADRTPVTGYALPISGCDPLKVERNISKHMPTIQDLSAAKLLLRLGVPILTKASTPEVQSQAARRPFGA